jgi:ligand-binding sensor domain-containing protein
MLITPDGVVWGITFNDGAFRFDPAHNWTIYTEKDGLPSSYIYSLSRAPSGELWFATFNGVARFDGSSWTIHVTRDGYTSKIDDEVVLFAPSGDVWVATTEGAYKLDMVTNQQINYPIGEKLQTHHIEYATLAANGTLWGANGDFVFQLTLAPTPKWTIHQIPYEHNYYRTFAIEGIAASSDGMLWIAGTSATSSGVLRFDPRTSEWTAYDHLTTEGALLGEPISSFAIAPDDSIWLGTYRNGAIRLRPSASNKVSDAEIVYYPESELVGNDGISAIAFAPDGAVWFGTRDSIIRCILE